MLAQRHRRWVSIKPYSAGTDFRRQIPMSKVDPRTERIKYL